MAEAAVPEVSLSTGSEAVFDTECTPCSADGQHEEAVSYCRDCGEYLCGDCVLDHKKVRSLKRHQLMDKDAMTATQGKPQVLDTCTEKCPEHKNEIIKLFCPDHNTTACVICAALKHKPCDRMEYIEDAAVGLEDRQDYKEFTAKLGDLTQQSEDTVTLALEKKQRTSDCHTKTMEDLDGYREELVIAVDRHVEAIRDQAGQIHAQDTDKMDKLASQGNKVLTELRALATNINSLKSRKHFCKLFVEMKRREQTVRQLRGDIERLTGDTVAAYTFRPDEDLRAMIGSQNGIGKLLITSTERGTSSATRNSDQVHSNQILSVPVRNVKNIKASHMTDIKVKSSSNTETCVLSGMVAVAGDKMVVTDWGNASIKLIDMNNNTILSEHKPEKSPWDVTTCHDTVAATIPYASKIVFLKHAGGLVRDREISVNGNCRGIDSYDDKLYVSYNEQKTLEVITTTGVVLQTFSTTSDGQQLFESPSYLTVNAVNQRIYVSEWNKDRVVVLDMAGNQTGTYKDTGKSFPKQMAVDGIGVMFLCYWDRNTVHLLSPDGEKVKILLTRQDGVVKPWSVCYCENTGRLYVGLSEYDIIKNYKLS